jgi:hypothetical protein
MVNDVLIRSDAGHRRLSEYSRPVERELIAGAEKVLSDFTGEYGWMDEHTDIIRAIIAYLKRNEVGDDEGDYAKNPANYQHHVVISEPIGITLSKEEEEIYKAFITGEQHD